MEEKIFCNVKNRSASIIIYRIPEEGIRREFAPGEVKRIEPAELEKLNYQQGGKEIIGHFLQVQSEKVMNDLGIKTEPEYNMSEQQVAELLKSGSLDAFLDCLDFAPVGVIDLVKKYSVMLPLQDYDKRKALKEKTGFDVDAALRNIEAEKAESKAEAAPAQRRVKADQPKEELPTGRRTSGTNYKVVSKIETNE